MSGGFDSSGKFMDSSKPKRVIHLNKDIKELQVILT